MRNRIVALVLASLPLGPCLAAEPGEENPRELARGLQRQMRKIIDAAEPSVVAVVVSHQKYPPLPIEERKQPGRLGSYSTPPPGLPSPHATPQPDLKLDLADPANAADNQFGSGLVLDQKGLILTSYHLIEGATKIYVRSAGGKGSYADIHAADGRSDLAVLKLIDPVPGLKPVTFGTVKLPEGPSDEKATVFRGMWIVTVGHPPAAGFGNGSPSANWGMLSNVRRKAPGPNREEIRVRPLYQYGTLLQTDARVTLGCSGGAILNLDGEVIALTSSIAAVSGADSAGGFAIPFDTNYRRIVDVLREGREVEYGFLGVAVDRPVLQGLPIASVTPGTPASEAGLVGGRNGGMGDVIVAIDGVPVKEQDDLFLQVGSALAGTKVRVTLLQSGKKRDIDVTLAKYYHTMPSVVTRRPPATHGLRVDYNSVRFLQMQMARDNIVSEVGLPAGVLIRELEEKSPAMEKLRPLGDVVGKWLITHVDGKLVTTPDAFARETAGKESIRLRVIDPTAPEKSKEVVLP